MLLFAWGSAALVIVVDHLRRGFGHLDLGAHPLQARSQRFNLFLLLSDNRFQILYLMMFFKKLV